MANQLYENPEESMRPYQSTGSLMVRKYKGTNKSLLSLNRSRGYLGTALMKTEWFNDESGALVPRSVWIVSTTDGDNFRIPEPIDGIDTVLDLRYKRIAVAEVEDYETESYD